MMVLMIRNLIVLLVSLCLVCQFSLASGAEGKGKGVSDKGVPKTSVPRETRMKASGVVKEITDSNLVLERNITGEVMEFQLEKSLKGISVGDKVAVSYVQTDGRNIAKRVIKNLPKQKLSPPPISADKGK